MKLTFKEKLTVAKNISIEIPLELLSFMVVPIAVAFTKKEDDRLPRCFRWFEDAPDYYDGEIASINGDRGWKQEHFPPPKNRTYLARVRWLLRNRIGYFSHKCLGVKVDEIMSDSIVTKGNAKVTSNKGVVSDFCKVTCVLKNGKKRFGYYRTIRWCSKFYIRIYLGWKLMDIANINDLSKYDGKKSLKTVWAFHPFKKVRL